MMSHRLGPDYLFDFEASNLKALHLAITRSEEQTELTGETDPNGASTVHFGGRVLPLAWQAEKGAANTSTPLSTGIGIGIGIGILHEPSHKAPWIIAMDCQPNRAKVRDYGSRWRIELMFSDFKIEIDPRNPTDYCC